LQKEILLQGINLEGSYSNNKILQYSFFDPQTGVTSTPSLNIGEEFQSSLNLDFNTKITEKWYRLREWLTPV
jgi:hypothetical protein